MNVGKLKSELAKMRLSAPPDNWRKFVVQGEHRGELYRCYAVCCADCGRTITLHEKTGLEAEQEARRLGWRVCGPVWDMDAECECLWRCMICKPAIGK